MKPIIPLIALITFAFTTDDMSNHSTSPALSVLHVKTFHKCPIFSSAQSYLSKRASVLASVTVLPFYSWASHNYATSKSTGFVNRSKVVSFKILWIMSILIYNLAAVPWVSNPGLKSSTWDLRPWVPHAYLSARSIPFSALWQCCCHYCIRISYPLKHSGSLSALGISCIF